jgi:membrane dipeptidase
VKRSFAAIAIVLIGIACAFLAIAPAYLEASMNKRAPNSIVVTRAALALHRRLSIADMHSDTLMWARDPLARATRGHVDRPRLEVGNVALQVFSSVSKTPRGQNYDSNGADTDNITALTIAQLQPPRTWTSLLQRSLFHAERLRRAEAASAGRLRIVRSQRDLRALLQARSGSAHPVGALLSVEGLQNLEGQQTNLARLYGAGFRMAGLDTFGPQRGARNGAARHGRRHCPLQPCVRR